MSLDIKKEVADIKAMYDASSTSLYFRCIIFGDIGSGKTYLQRTCPRPVHVDSFDPGGQKTNRKMIEEGWLVADTTYENEDPKNPSAIMNWDTAYNRRKKEGYFEYFGTYVLDGLTMFGQAALNYTLKKKGRVDGIPKVEARGGDNDYVIQKALMGPMLRDIFNLPCHVIITAHPDLSTDEDSGGKKIIGPAVVGQLKTQLPLMCDEIYNSQTAPTKEGDLKYRLLTKQDGIFRCRSRLAANGMIEMYEDQDIRKILKKAGYPAEDKPMW